MEILFCQWDWSSSFFSKICKIQWLQAAQWFQEGDQWWFSAQRVEKSSAYSLKLLQEWLDHACNITKECNFEITTGKADDVLIIM